MHEKKLLCCLITAASKVIGVTTPIGWDRCEGSLQRIRKAGISGTFCIPAESYTCLTILPKPLSEREIFAKTNLSHQRTVTFFFFFFQEDIWRLRNSLPDQLYDTLDKSLYAIILKDLSNISYLIWPGMNHLFMIYHS